MRPKAIHRLSPRGADCAFFLCRLRDLHGRHRGFGHRYLDKVPAAHDQRRTLDGIPLWLADMLALRPSANSARPSEHSRESGVIPTPLAACSAELAAPNSACLRDVLSIFGGRDDT